MGPTTSALGVKVTQSKSVTASQAVPVSRVV
jgi:hypothetical protein